MRTLKLGIFSELEHDMAGRNLFFLFLICTLCFSLFYLLSASVVLHQRIRSRFQNLQQEGVFLWGKLSGFLFLGILPVLALLIGFPNLTVHEIGVSADMEGQNTILWFGGLSVLFLGINLIIGRTTEVQQKHPQMRFVHWNARQLGILILGWFLYILAYEFFFRGLLLFPLVAKFGIWPAIGCNVFLYTLAHIQQGTGETIGAMFFGVLFCLASIDTGSFWVAFATHLIFSLSGNFAALYFNKGMYFSNSKKRKSS